MQNMLILWTGPRHSGKSTSVADLAQLAHDEDFEVAGLLAPSVYHDGELIGFDAVDLRNGTKAPLARQKAKRDKTMRFTFIDKGLKLGGIATSREATELAELVIVDEFGPLELDSKGWRENVDLLLASSTAVVLLVVREELVEQVSRLYASFGTRKLNATEPQSIDKVINLLKERRQIHLRIK